MCQEIRTTCLLGLLLKDFDEETADNLALLFRIILPFKFTDEQLTRVAMDQFYVEPVAERLDDLFRLALTQQTVIHEDTRELLADRLMYQDSRHGGINAARQSADHIAVADLFADLGNFLLAEVRHRPVSATARNLVDKVPQQLGAL